MSIQTLGDNISEYLKNKLLVLGFCCAVRLQLLQNSTGILSGGSAALEYLESSWIYQCSVRNDLYGIFCITVPCKEDKTQARWGKGKLVFTRQ